MSDAGADKTDSGSGEGKPPPPPPPPKDGPYGPPASWQKVDRITEAEITDE